MLRICSPSAMSAVTGTAGALSASCSRFTDAAGDGDDLAPQLMEHAANRSAEPAAKRPVTMATRSSTENNVHRPVYRAILGPSRGGPT